MSGIVLFLPRLSFAYLVDSEIFLDDHISLFELAVRKLRLEFVPHTCTLYTHFTRNSVLHPQLSCPYNPLNYFILLNCVDHIVT